MKPANLLIIMSDEHDPRWMGCSGNELVQTPNLDRLAARGTRFSDAYTACPICVPASRPPSRCRSHCRTTAARRG